jgi:N-acetylmuramoyl-L-alanine amidase
MGVDWKKTLGGLLWVMMVWVDPVASQGPPSTVPVRMVVDPAHGGRERGARGLGGTLEKELNLTLARELREEARAMGGFQVILTREEDETFSWARRRESGAGADVWLSIHVNADFEGRARGPRVFYPGIPEAANQKNDHKTPPGKSSDVGLILQDMARTKKGNESVLLGEHLQRALDAAWGSGSRPSREAPLFGIGELDCPSVAVEVGFVSHPGDLRNLQDAGRRKQIVRAILRGVRFFVQDPRRAQ